MSEMTSWNVLQGGVAGQQEGERRQIFASEMPVYATQNRLAYMKNQDALRMLEVNKMIDSDVGRNLLVQQQPQQPVATQPQPAPTQPQPAPIQNNLVPPPVPGGMYGQVANMATTPPAGAQPMGTPAAQPQPPTDEQMLQTQMQSYKGLRESGKIDDAEYSRLMTGAMAQSDGIKIKRSTEQLGMLKVAVEQGKLNKEQQLELTSMIEPIARAQTPLTQKYEAMVASGIPEQQAIETLQPMYSQMIQDMGQIPGLAKAAETAPKRFSPLLAYSMADTFKALEEQKLTATKEDAKLNELTRSGMITPGGKMIFTNKRGEKFVDGQPYHGRDVKPSVKNGGGSSAGIPSEGKVMGALNKGKPSDAVEFAAQYLAFYGKLPPGMGRSKGGDNVREKAFARVSEIARDAGMTLPELFAAGADVKANVAAMSKQKGLIANLEGSELQAQKNLTRLHGLFKQLGNGTVPMLNGVVNRMKKGMGAPAPGTAEAVAYETMIEYTRVVTRQTTGAAPTDSAMKNTNDLISVLKDNPAMIDQKFTQFRGLMKDSLNSQKEVYEEMRQHLGKGVAAPQASPAPKPTGSKIPAGAQTGKYHGEPAYTTDGGKSFFSQATGRRL